MNLDRDVDLMLMEIGIAADEDQVREIVKIHFRKLYYRGRRHVRDYLEAIEISATLDKGDLQ